MTRDTNKIHIAGDIEIKEISIITSQGFKQEVTLQTMGIEIYEDIFANFITGKIFLNDSHELTNLLPLIGEEYIRIHVRTPSLDPEEDYNMEFAIYKMDDRFKTKERELIYVLHFISKEAIIDLNKKLSRGFKGKVSDIVKEICEKEIGTSKKLDIEDTKNQTRFISNFWNPIRCIQWVTDQAVNTDNSPSYLFWETNYGFHFRSLLSLYQGTPIKQRFVWDNYSAEIDKGVTGGSSYHSIERDFQRIMELDIKQSWDYIERLKSGMYGSQIIYYDLFTHQYVHNGFNPDWDEKKSLNPYPLWTDKVPMNSRAVLMHDHQYRNVFDDYDDVSNTKIRQERRSILAQAEGYKISINVLGRCDYHAGQRVRVEVPLAKQIKENETDKLDKLMSGNYVIGALCHLITREKHQCTMELIKDSYLRELQ